MKELKRQPNSRTCFLCGRENDISLKMTWYNDDEEQKIYSEITIPEKFNSYPGIAHGGVVAAILDETSGRAVMLNDRFNNLMVTMKLEVTYRQPTPCGEPLKVIGWVTKETGSRAHVEAELRKQDGTLTAACKGIIVRPPKQVMERWEEDKEFWKVYED